MELNRDNYFSPEADSHYMSSSQLHTFMDCPSRALAELHGKYQRPYTTALLQGSYVDAWVEGRLDEFIFENPEIISSKGPTKGELKAEFRHLDTIIARMERDEFFMSFLEGKKQMILTGEIGGVPFKGKPDIYNEKEKRIVDTKAVRDFKAIWSDELGAKLNFISFWNWHMQGAIYCELARQNGLVVNGFFDAVVTKETEPDLGVFHIPNSVLDENLRHIAHVAQHYHAIKLGIIDPGRCERCDWCKRTKVLTDVTNWEELDGQKL